MTMTNEVRQFYVDWVAKLRSGTIKQGKTKLHRVEENKMCCLGVACLIAGLTPVREFDTNWFYHYDEESNYLPESFAAKIGLSKEMQDKLTDMNDSEFLPFARIADYIEDMYLSESPNATS
jgi:hypothetical protein